MQQWNDGVHLEYTKDKAVWRDTDSALLGGDIWMDTVELLQSQWNKNHPFRRTTAVLTRYSAALRFNAK
jgi:hypothetical protein